MKRIYEAANAIEAHMIVHLLGQAGIEGRVEGEYLQGGVGELPAVGLVGVATGTAPRTSSSSRWTLSPGSPRWCPNPGCT
ncbi:MAG: hypothetical protein AMXMBFR8_14270 [Nevskiales bacterium]